MANYQYVTTDGVIVPDTSDLLTGVETEFRDAFGADLVVTPDTPQGVLITAETLSRAAVVRNNASLANQINPNLAGGIFLDAIMALTGAERDANERSTVVAQLTGVAGTVIPALTRAATSPDGDLFELVTTVIIEPSGNVSGEFQSVEYGPVPALAGTLTQIVDGVLGWETVTNADAATLGRVAQSDQGARAFRKNTLAGQGSSIAEAITSGLYKVDGVRSLTFRENNSNATVTIDGISLVAYSIWTCVDGGLDLDVATALLKKKSGGANYNGAVTVNVIEPASGQTFPVKFDRPTDVPVITRVTIKASSSVTDPTSAVRSAVLAFAAGELEEEPGFTVGNDVSPFELSGAVNRQFPTIYVQKVEVSLASPVSYSTDPVSIALDEIATINGSGVTVVIV